MGNKKEKTNEMRKFGLAILAMSATAIKLATEEDCCCDDDCQELCDSMREGAEAIIEACQAIRDGDEFTDDGTDGDDEDSSWYDSNQDGIWNDEDWYKAAYDAFEHNDGDGWYITRDGFKADEWPGADDEDCMCQVAVVTCKRFSTNH